MAYENAPAIDQMRTALVTLKSSDHVALLYESSEEQFAAIVPYFRIGLERSEFCLYATDDNSPEEVIQAMNEGGIDTELHLHTGALAVVTKEESYLRQEVFDPDEMIRFIDMAIKSALNAGFTGFRATGEGTWALSTKEGLERIIDYEKKIDHLFPGLSAQAVCQYNVNCFPPETLLAVIRTHSLIIYKGKLCQNDFYVPPIEDWSADRALLEVTRQLDCIHARGIG